MADEPISPTPTTPADAGQHLAELEAVYRQAPVGLAMIDRELRYRRVNERLAAMNGRSVEDHIGRTFRDIIPEVADAAAAIARGVFETGRPLSDVALSAETSAMPGVIRHWLQQWYPVLDASGTVVGINIVVEEATGRMHLEAQLRASEERNRFLLELSDRLRGLDSDAEIHFEAARAVGEHLEANRVGFAEIDGDGTGIVVSRNYVHGVPGVEGHHRMADYSRSLPAALHAGSIVARDDVRNDPTLSDDERAAHAALRVNAAVDLPYLRDGKLLGLMFVHFVDAHPWHDEELSLLRSVAARVWDAVDRARAEAALRGSQARLQLALDVAELGTWEWDLTTGAGSVDARTAEIIGIGDVDDVADAQRRSIHPDDLPAVEAAIGAGIAAGGSFDIDYRVVHPDGSVRHVASRAQAQYDEAGRPVRLLGTNRDATTERDAAARLTESEARYRSLFASIDEGFCVIEVLFDESGRPYDYRFIEANPAFVEQTGLVDSIGRTMREFAPDHESEWYERYGRVVRTGESIRIEAPAAALGRWYDVNAFRIGAPDQNRVAVLFRDVGERKRAEAERERLLQVSENARAEAEAANRAKSEFLAVMSHELRTPLNAIGGYTELIELGIHGPVSDAQRSALSRIQASQRHLLGLINEVLNYARIDAGAVQYELVPVTVDDALAAAEGLVRPQADARLHMFVREPIAPDIRVRADREKLQQILLNLLSNAIKFTEPQGTIALSCTVEEERVAITVTDSGIGIPERKLGTIFEPFVQIDQRLARRQEGVGLGLAISRDLAHGMHGELVARSVEGEGSAFTLTLPRAFPQAGSPDARVTTASR